MLELRPTCENCNTALPPDSAEAMICTFECTFCRDCVQRVLENVCPNCGGGFCQRPNRPRADLRNGNNLEKYPASANRIYQPVNPAAHREFASRVKNIPPPQR